MSDVIERVRRSGVVPVVVVDDPEQAQRLGKALHAGGMSVIEVTLRTPAASEAIRVLSRMTDLIVGAGSVLTPEQVDQVVDAGAQFVISPGLSRPVVERSLAQSVPVVPGVATATEILAALELGVNVVKFFPAEVLGGPAAITSLAAPFPGVGFIPTGGVSPENLGRYLALPSVIAVGGSWMVERSLISEGRWDEVTRRARAALDAVVEFRSTQGRVQ
jgi:2-dehydro-3-deoxyphosphogluconate aldolase/(4S)-4-hydroxy-2-oxoglutarate aldolase